jgi:hypothetical protein
VLKRAFTTNPRLAAAIGLWQGGRMDSRSPQAGGCLLILCILVGGWWGLQAGLTGRGLIYGTAAGVVAALAVWLFDRLRRGR